MAPDRPSEAEREWLMARLADLVGEGGFERFVGSALIEISDAWFPDRWSPSAAGVEVLLRRLFWHAGLPEVEVEVEDLRGHDPGEVGREGRISTPLACRTLSRTWIQTAGNLAFLV